LLTAGFFVVAQTGPRNLSWQSDCRVGVWRGWFARLDSLVGLLLVANWCSSERSLRRCIHGITVREANAGWLDPRNGPRKDKLIAQIERDREKNF